MKHPLQTTEQFIACRAKGWSYGRIAEHLGISKATAWDWAVRFKSHIDKFRAIELESIRERLLADYQAELSSLATELNRVQAELRDRDYGYVDTQQLFWYQNSLMARLDKKFPPITMPDPSPDTPEPPTERNRTEPNEMATPPDPVSPDAPSRGANFVEPQSLPDSVTPEVTTEPISRQLSANPNPSSADTAQDSRPQANIALPSGG
jgi:hypothetical protein